jgi:phosphoribosylpyrophosphate synthetase
VAATHGLFVGSSVTRLKPLPIKHLFVTDSLVFGNVDGLPLEVVSIAGILAESIGSLVGDREIAQPMAAAG